MITGSHNPPEWNGFKLANDFFTTLLKPDLEEVYNIIVNEDFIKGRGIAKKRNIKEDYGKDILWRIKIVKPIKVVVDAGNGTAGVFAPGILKKAGCNVIEIFCKLDSSFPHHFPNPSDRSARKALREKVIEMNADLGISFDGDGDRLGVIDEHGNDVWSDRLLIPLARHVLENKPGSKIVFDVKSTRALVEDVKDHGGKPIMWITGHSYIKQKMKEVKAPLGGERSGHIFFGDDIFHGYDDAIFASLKLIEFLSNQKKSLNEIMRTVTPYHASTEIQVACPDDIKYDVVDRLIADFKKDYKNVITINGARVEFEDGWGLVRASSNLPVLVLTFEAETRDRLEEIKRIFKKKLTQYPEIHVNWQNDINPSLEAIEISGVKDVFVDRWHAQNDIKKALSEAKGEIWLMGVSLRDFLLKNMPLNKQFIKCINSQGIKKIKILLINPRSDAAINRARREEGHEFHNGAPYENSVLYREVTEGMSNILSFCEKYKKIEARAYYGAPSYFLVKTDTSMFVEPYHYGESPSPGYVGRRVNIIEHSKNSIVYDELSSHYEYIWGNQSTPISPIKEITGHIGSFDVPNFPLGQAGITRIFPSRRMSLLRISKLLKSTAGEIKIMGITLRDFFNEAGGLQPDIKQILKNRNTNIKVLLIHPDSESAEERARIQFTLTKGSINGFNYNNSILYFENTQSQNNIKHLQHLKRIGKLSGKIELRLYNNPSTFLFITKKSILVQHYLFGQGETEAVPLEVTEYFAGSVAYQLFNQHFDFHWNKSKSI